jgi:trk system potassium uptake protein TrkA
MHIIILGAGQVGGTLAKNLAREENDITLVDLDENKLRSLQHRLDIQTIKGSGAHPNILIDAGIEQADMLIAVTNSDEINMIACQIAYSIFRTPTKIARVRSRNYYEYPDMFTKDHIPVDVCISPELLVTQHIEKLIEYPGTSQVLDFAEGSVLLVTISPQKKGLMVGKTLSELYEYLSEISAKVVAIFRDNKAIKLSNDSLIKHNDQVVFIASANAIRQVLIALGRYSHPNRRIMIAGGGHIGRRLARALESRYRIKVIERSQERASYIATLLDKTTILQGDIADRELLINENIEFVDFFCAVTNDDETNIMSCLQAKKLGARYAMALVNRSAYAELIEDSSIDHAISPQYITIGSILAKLRRGDMVKVHRLHSGKAEAIEVIAHGSQETSKVVGRAINQLNLPPSSSVIAVVRDKKVFLANQDLIIEEEDHVILLVLERRYMKQVEYLFQVKLGFFN